MSKITDEDVNQAKKFADELGKLVSLEFKSGDYPAAGKVYEIEGVRHVMVPNNCNLHSFERLLPRPQRVQAKVLIRELDSFIAYIRDNSFATQATTIFAIKRPDRLEATCVFDYHESATTAGWGSHRANLTTMFSREWQEWNKMSGSPMSQEEFVTWIEDHVGDFHAPAGTEMLTVAQNIEARQNVEWKGSIRTGTGDVQLSYVSETKTGGAGNIELPSSFTLRLPPFEGGVLYAVNARLRCKLSDGQLSLQFDLLQPQKVIDHAMAEVIKRIADETKFTPLIGELPAQ